MARLKIPHLPVNGSIDLVDGQAGHGARRRALRGLGFRRGGLAAGPKVRLEVGAIPLLVVRLIAGQSILCVSEGVQHCTLTAHVHKQGMHHSFFGNDAAERVSEAGSMPRSHAWKTKAPARQENDICVL
jgi:hypothetical protein